jgi:hypothetical protein
MFRQLKSELLRLYPIYDGNPVRKYRIRRSILTSTPDERTYYVEAQLQLPSGKRAWVLYDYLDEVVADLNSKGVTV